MKYFTAEMISWLREHYPLHMLRDLTPLFNKQFGLDKTIGQLKACTKNHQILAGRKGNGSKRKFLNVHLNWIEKNYPLFDTEAFTKRFNKRFSMECTSSQLGSLCKRYGFKCGRTGHFVKGEEAWNKGTSYQPGGNSYLTQFKPGQNAINQKPLGSERTTVDGYIQVKTMNPNIWALKQRIIYAEHNGPIPPSHMVTFKDLDKTNMDIGNLMLVSMAENAVINRFGMSKFHTEARQTGLLIAKLHLKASERMR
jgi:hypothetical protein